MPPESLLLIHGAGSGPAVFAGWAGSFPGLTVEALDLQEGLTVASASHADYAERVVDAAGRLAQPVALCGWSMGGLAALQAAPRVRPHSVILIEASAPAEVQGFHPEVPNEEGTFDPEEVYGPMPGVAARPESLLARAERKRGISVPSLPCPSLVISGDAFRHERGRPVADLYGSELRDFPGLDHLDLVRDHRVRDAIADFLGL